MLVQRNFTTHGRGVYNNPNGPIVGGHAMVVVGYDDKINAFKVMNSWGKGWGESGFGWISYPVFHALVREAYATQDIITNIEKRPDNPEVVISPPPKPTPQVVVAPPPPRPNSPLGKADIDHELDLKALSMLPFSTTRAQASSIAEGEEEIFEGKNPEFYASGNFQAIKHNVTIRWLRNFWRYAVFDNSGSMIIQTLGIFFVKPVTECNKTFDVFTDWYRRQVNAPTPFTMNTENVTILSGNLKSDGNIAESAWTTVPKTTTQYVAENQKYIYRLFKENFGERYCNIEFWSVTK